MIYGQPITLGGKKAEGEISITANGTYDVAEYASANVNVQSAPVLLWTNASPNSEFGKQTISLDLSSFGGVIVEVGNMQGGVNVDKSFGYAPKKSGYQPIGGVRPGYDGSWGYENGTTYGKRDVTVTDSGVTFQDGYSTNNYVVNGYVIPTRIWGVKGVIE